VRRSQWGGWPGADEEPEARVERIKRQRRRSRCLLERQEALEIGNQQHITHYDVPARSVFDPARFDLQDLGIDVRPSFSIRPEDRIFVIGSCFAREIDTAMTRAGFRVAGGALGNKYNTLSMLQAVRWMLGEAAFDASLVAEMADGRWFDGHRHPVAYHASAEMAATSHREMLADMREGLISSDVVVMTLGLVEVWRDNVTGAWLNCTPPRAMCDDTARYEMIRTTHAANLAALTEILALLRRDKARRIVCSVSPVPLFATFTDADVLVANTYSKSTLRSVADEAIAAAGAGVDYFPSYELATLSARRRVWRPRHLTGEPDGRHVLPEFVQNVILPLFMDRYVDAPAAVA